MIIHVKRNIGILLLSITSSLQGTQIDLESGPDDRPMAQIIYVLFIYEANNWASPYARLSQSFNMSSVCF